MVVLLPIALVALAAAMATVAVPSAQAAEQLYRLDIRVTSELNQQPAVYARVKMAPDVERVEIPDSLLSMARLHVHGLELDDTGRLVVLVKEGEYGISVTMDGHKAVDLKVTVPGSEMSEPESGQIPTRRIPIELPVSSKQAPRDIMVTVMGETTDAEGRKGTARLPDAAVSVISSDSGVQVQHTANGQARTCRTGGDGVAVFHAEEGLAVGDSVRVRATKPEYDPAEQTLTIGGGGPESPSLGLSSVTASDAVALTLRKSPAKPQQAKLIVRVVDAGSGEPVAGADVYIKPIGAEDLGPVQTGADGRTGAFILSLPASSGVHTSVRLSVRREGYAEKWDDVANEYLAPGLEPRVYPVQLTKVGGPHWTAAEQAAFARYRAWAAGKGGKEDPPMFGTEPTGRFNWQEPYRTPDGRSISITFTTRCVHLPDHPPGPRPDPNDDAIRGQADLAKVTIGGHPGIGSSGANHGARFSWQHGWFDASLSVYSPWITHPELGEVNRWAEQMAGVIGDPGQ